MPSTPRYAIVRQNRGDISGAGILERRFDLSSPRFVVKCNDFYLTGTTSRLFDRNSSFESVRLPIKLRSKTVSTSRNSHAIGHGIRALVLYPAILKDGPCFQRRCSAAIRFVGASINVTRFAMATVLPTPMRTKRSLNRSEAGIKFPKMIWSSCRWRM